MYIFRTALNSYEQDNNGTQPFQRIRSGSISGEAANNSSPPSSPISPSTLTNFLQLWPGSTTVTANATIPTNANKPTTTATNVNNNPETTTIPSLQRRASEASSQMPYNKLVLLRRNTLPSYMSPFAGLNPAEKSNHSSASYWEEDSVQVAMKTFQFGI